VCRLFVLFPFYCFSTQYIKYSRHINFWVNADISNKMQIILCIHWINVLSQHKNSHDNCNSNQLEIWYFKKIMLYYINIIYRTYHGKNVTIHYWYVQQYTLFLISRYPSSNNPGCDWFISTNCMNSLWLRCQYTTFKHVTSSNVREYHLYLTHGAQTISKYDRPPYYNYGSLHKSFLQNSQTTLHSLYIAILLYIDSSYGKFNMSTKYQVSRFTYVVSKS
jgi:hypothetical protein